jgi:hypothetical protein
MSKYYHIKKTSVPAFIRRLNAIESKTGIFYNIAVLPYRGKKYSPDLYATVKIG